MFVIIFFGGLLLCKVKVSEAGKPIWGGLMRRNIFSVELGKRTCMCRAVKTIYSFCYIFLIFEITSKIGKMREKIVLREKIKNFTGK